MISKQTAHAFLVGLIFLTILCTYAVRNGQFTLLCDTKPLNRISCPEDLPKFLSYGSENEKPHEDSKLIGLKIFIRHGARTSMKDEDVDNDVSSCDIQNITTQLYHRYQERVSNAF